MLRFQFRAAALSALFLGLCACGGGGSPPAPTPTPTPATYTIGGTVTGLSGSGLVLQLNGGNNLTIAANGAFSFTSALATGTAYAVTVLTQPSGPAQTCTVTGGTGSVASANVTNVAVNCPAPTFSIGGTVTGLTGSGLVLQLNGANNLSVTTNGPFTFAASLAAGAAYAVTVQSQPSNQPQNCTVANGSGNVAAANITNVAITCVPIVFKTTTGKLKTTRAMFGATLLNDGKVLVTGGLIDSALNATNTAEIYDPATNTSTLLTAHMTSFRNQHTSTLLPNGQVLIAGGSPSGNGDGMNTAELYNPTTQGFTAVSATMKSPRGGHTATLLQNGKVLLVAGFNNGPPVLSAELYDPVANTFTIVSAASSREGFGASLLANGKVLVTGGTTSGATKGNPLGNSNELYDPTPQTFSALGAAMSTARSGHFQVTMPNGQVLIGGGIGAQINLPNVTALASAEVYNPANTFTALSASLTTPRFGAGAVLLANGTVLILGGGTGTNSAVVMLDTVEVYGP